MEIRKTTGIVLSTGIFGEADKLSKIFTKEFGKRKFVFKGIKKSKTRPQAVAEPGTIVNLVYYFSERRDIHVVNEFNIFKQYLEIRKDLDKIYTLYFLLEITEKTTGFSDPNIKLFNLLVSGIDTLSKTKYVIHLSLFFVIHLIRIHGILSDFSRCKICKDKGYNRFTLDIVDFRPICENCSGNHNKNRNLFFFNGEHKDLLLMILREKFISISHADYHIKEISNILFYLVLFVESYFHIEIKSKKALFSNVN